METVLPTEKMPRAWSLETGWQLGTRRKHPSRPRKGKGLRRGADPVGPCRPLERLWLYVCGIQAPCDSFPPEE